MKLAGKIAGTSAVAAAALGTSAALTPSYAQVVDGWYHMGWGNWLVGGLWFVIIAALLIALAVVVIRAFSHRPDHSMQPPERPRPSAPSPLDILAERFARGEIDTAEYEERRQVLSDQAKASD
jgi:putative membrane protein